MAKLETETHCTATCLSFWRRCWRTVGRCWKKTTKTFHFCYFASTTKRKRFHQQAATYKKDIERKIHFATSFSNFTNFQASNRLVCQLEFVIQQRHWRLLWRGVFYFFYFHSLEVSVHMLTPGAWEMLEPKTTETLQDLGQGLANQDASLSEFWVLANHELPKKITGVASSIFIIKIHQKVILTHCHYH